MTRRRDWISLGEAGETVMKRAQWPKASIHTVNERRAAARHLDRRNAKVERVLVEMAHGAALHLHFDRKRGPLWTLSEDGVLIDAEIAALVIAHPDVAPVGDSLFAGAPSQTYRYAGD
jgi:hypothetical protein